MIRDLADIGFPNLIETNLSFNQLESVEAVSRIYWPQLQKLFLGIDGISTEHNHVSKIASFSKAHCPMLR